MVVKIMVPFGYPKYSVPHYNRDPRRDHNFDNHPYASQKGERIRKVIGRAGFDLKCHLAGWFCT